MAEDRLHHRFGRFLIVGAINTAFGYAVYALLLLVGLPPQVALVLAFIIGTTWNYFTTARLVFRASGFRRLPHYIAAYLTVYAANALSLQTALDWGVDPFVAQAALTPVFAVMAFVLLSLVFRGQARSA